MKKYLTGNDVKKGEKYFFVDTFFNYIGSPKIVVKERTVYRVITGDFSTKDEGDQYEVEQFMAFKSEEDAKEYAVKKLEEYRVYLNKMVDKAVKCLNNNSL